MKYYGCKCCPPRSALQCTDVLSQPCSGTQLPRLQGLGWGYIQRAWMSRVRSHVNLWDIKFISTLFWTTTDWSAKTTSLIDIFEPHQFCGGGLFKNLSYKSKYYIKMDK